MASVQDIQIAVFSIIGLISIILAALFRGERYVDDLFVAFPWLEGFKVPWAISVYGLIALSSILVVVFLQQSRKKDSF